MRPNSSADMASAPEPRRRELDRQERRPSRRILLDTSQPPPSTARHTTNPPDSCLSRPLWTHIRCGQQRCLRSRPTAPPGGRLWHGFAVRRPRVGGAGRGLTYVLIPAQSRAAGDRGCVKPKTAPTFFTERSLAAYLAVSDRTVRNWIRRGDLPSYKLGASRRIDPADVENFLARHREESA